MHQTLQPLLGDMRIDLRRRQIAVAQHHLDRSQVRAIIYQMGRKCMTQCMG